MYKLQKLEKKRDYLKSLLSVEDDFNKYFKGGMVGFKNGSGKKRWERGIAKDLKLIRELREVEEKIDRIKNPLVRKKDEFVEPSTFNIGQKVKHLGTNRIVEVIKINRKTVTVRYSETFKESVEASLLKSF